MNAKFSLRQLLFGVTAWSIFLGSMVAEWPDWVYAFALIAASAASLLLLAKCDSPVVAGFLSLPLICLANWSAFLIALGYDFGDTSIVSTVLGPIAWVAALPVVLVQNSVPLAGMWDTIFGIAVVSAIETLALLFVVVLGRRYVKHRRPTAPPSPTE